MTNRDICNVISVLGPLAMDAREELQRVFIRIDREGTTIAATDGHVAAVICTPDCSEQPCDGWLPAFIAKGFATELTEEYADGGEYVTNAATLWADEWRKVMREPDDGAKLEKILGILPRPAGARRGMPPMLSGAMTNAMLIAGRVGAGILDFRPGEKVTDAVRIDAKRHHHIERDILFHLVLAVMPGRAAMPGRDL